MINVIIARDLQGLPRGFAHVEFSNELEAQNALLLSGGGSPNSGNLLVLGITALCATEAPSQLNPLLESMFALRMLVDEFILYGKR